MGEKNRFTRSRHNYGGVLPGPGKYEKDYVSKSNKNEKYLSPMFKAPIYSKPTMPTFKTPSPGAYNILPRNRKYPHHATFNSKTTKLRMFQKRNHNPSPARYFIRRSFGVDETDPFPVLSRSFHVKVKKSKPMNYESSEKGMREKF